MIKVTAKQQEVLNCRKDIDNNPESILTQLEAGDFSDVDLRVIKKALKVGSRWQMPTAPMRAIAKKVGVSLSF